MTLHDQIIPPCRDMLKAVAGMLAKARANGGDPLLSAAIAPDMHPLATQLRFITNMPGEAASRLTGQDMPHWADDDPKSIDEAGKRIAEVDAALAAIEGDAMCAADKIIELALPNGMDFAMSAENYVRDWALPNFYFHVSTAYLILRNRAVPLGKSDYIPHMARYFTAKKDG